MLDAMDVAITNIGLNMFNQQELLSQFDQLCKKIDIGIHRSGLPTLDDGGLLALRTGIPPLTLETWKQVKQGSESIVCAYGGSHWIVGHAIKDEHNSISVRQLIEHFIVEEEKSITFDRFVEFMAETIIVACLKNNLAHVSTLAVSFGFSHVNERTEYGVEGILTTAFLSKGWSVHDWNKKKDRRLAKALMEQINRTGMLHIERVVFLNDTCAVALDLGSAVRHLAQGTRILPIGMVCGTGTNACICYQNELINLEITEVPLDNIDIIMSEMQSRSLIYPRPILEHYTGIFIPYRLGIAVELLGEMQLLPHGRELGQAIFKSDGALLSQLASGQKTAQELSEQWKLPLETDTLKKLQLLALLALYKAGQIYGLILSVVVNQVRKDVGISLDKDIVLTEGSVLHKGYQMKKVTEKTCQQLGQQKITMIKSSGLAGIAAFAMSLNYLSRV